MADDGNEQLFHDLEQRHVSLRREHELVLAERDSMKAKITGLQKDNDESKQHIERLQKEVGIKDIEIKQRERTFEEIRQNLEDANGLCSRRSQECDRLREDLKSQTDELAEIRNKYKRLQDSDTESREQLAPIQHKLTRVERERRLFADRVAELEADLQAKLQDLVDIKREHSTELIDIKSKLIDAEGVGRELQGRIKALQDRATLQEEKIDQYNTKLTTAEETIANQQSQFEQELEGKTKLADLYKRHFDESAQKVEELEQAAAATREATKRQFAQQASRSQTTIDELQEMLEGERLANAARIQELEESNVTLLAEKDALEQQLQELQQQVEHSGLTFRGESALAVIGELTASASASSSFASPFSPSRGGSGRADSSAFLSAGLKPTELLSRLAQAEQAFATERGKAQELQLFLHRILKEIEEKAPVISQQRREHAQVMESYVLLTKKLDEASAENVSLREALKSYEQRVRESSDEVVLVRQQNRDLALQVQGLLRSTSGGGDFGSHSGGSVSGGAGRRQSSGRPVAMVEAGDGGNDFDTPDDVISTYLVPVDNITQMQEKNQQLLELTRKLAMQQERDQVALQASSVNEEASAQLAAALKELASMRDARQRTEEMVRGLVMQRDMYKAMVDDADEYNGGGGGGGSSFGGNTSVSFGSIGRSMSDSMAGAPTPGVRSTAGASFLAAASAVAPVDGVGGAGDFGNTSFDSFGSLTPGTLLMSTPGTALQAHGPHSAASTGGGSAGGGAGRLGSPQVGRSPPFASASQRDALEARAKIQELTVQLMGAEDDRKALRDRIGRLEDTEKAQSDALNKMRDDLHSLRMEAATAKGEARHHSERADRMEQAGQQLQNEAITGQQKRQDLEKMLVEYQEQSRTKEDRITQMTASLRAAEDEKRRAEIEADVCKKGEARLAEQISQLREELKRQQQLTDSISRIEAGLSSRIEEEKAGLLQEKDSLARALDSLRKQMAEKTLIDDKQLRELGEELKAAKTRVEEKASEASAAREELIRSQASDKAAREKVVLLEKQLEIAQSTSQSLQGRQVMETVMSSDLAERDLMIERQQIQLNTLHEKLAKEASAAGEYRKVAAATEEALAELRERTEAARSAFDAETATLRSQVESLHEDLARVRGAEMASLREVEEARQQLRDQAKEHAAKLRTVEDSASLAGQAAIQAEAQMEQLKADVARFQASSRSSHDNYERELQLHAESERNRRALQTQLDQAREALAAEQQKSAALLSDAIRKEQQATELRMQAEQVETGLREELRGLRSANELLHAQVQSLGIQVDRLNESRLSGLGLDTPGAAAGQDTDSSSSQQQQQQDGAPAPELQELRKMSTELREVLRYTKRERDMLEAKLGGLELENNRHLGTLAATQRALDEARAELRQELDKRTAVRSEDEFARLMAEVAQLNLIRESREHLRVETEQQARVITELREELRIEKENLAPLQSTVRSLSAAVEGLEMDKEALTNDAQYWQQRLTQLTERYNEVDPEEHRLLKQKLEEITEERDSLQNDNAELTRMGAEKEAAHKERVDDLTRTVSVVREEVQKQARALEARGAELQGATAALDEAKAKVEQLEASVKSKDDIIEGDKARKSKLMEYIAKLKEDHTTKNSKIGTLQEEIRALKAGASSAQAAPAQATASVPVGAPAGGGAAGGGVDPAAAAPVSSQTASQEVSVASGTLGSAPTNTATAPAAAVSAPTPAPAAAPAAAPATTVAAAAAAQDESAKPSTTTSVATAGAATVASSTAMDAESATGGGSEQAAATAAAELSAEEKEKSARDALMAKMRNKKRAAPTEEPPGRAAAAAAGGAAAAAGPAATTTASTAPTSIVTAAADSAVTETAATTKAAADATEAAGGVGVGVGVDVVAGATRGEEGGGGGASPAKKRPALLRRVPGSTATTTELQQQQPSDSPAMDAEDESALTAAGSSEAATGTQVEEPAAGKGADKAAVGGGLDVAALRAGAPAFTPLLQQQQSAASPALFSAGGSAAASTQPIGGFGAAFGTPTAIGGSGASSNPTQAAAGQAKTGAGLFGSTPTPAGSTGNAAGAAVGSTGGGFGSFAGAAAGGSGAGGGFGVFAQGKPNVFGQSAVGTSSGGGGGLVAPKPGTPGGMFSQSNPILAWTSLGAGAGGVGSGLGSSGPQEPLQEGVTPSQRDDAGDDVEGYDLAGESTFVNEDPVGARETNSSGGGGAFLQLRPPSPSNKAAVPKFGSGSVSLPVPSLSVGGTPSAGGPGPLFGRTNSGDSSMSVPIGGVSPRVMGSSIFAAALGGQGLGLGGLSTPVPVPAISSGPFVTTPLIPKPSSAGVAAATGSTPAAVAAATGSTPAASSSAIAAAAAESSADLQAVEAASSTDEAAPARPVAVLSAPADMSAEAKALLRSQRFASPATATTTTTATAPTTAAAPSAAVGGASSTAAAGAGAGNGLPQVPPKLRRARPGAAGGPRKGGPGGRGPGGANTGGEGGGAEDGGGEAN